MSDTPIAEQLAAALDMPWPLRRSWLINGHIYEEAAVAVKAGAVSTPEDSEMDTRMLVNSGNDEDGEPNMRPWLSIKDDNPPEPRSK